MVSAHTPQSIYAALKFYFGFDKFKGDQEQIISSLLAGEDVFVLMPTGGGKSLCYQLPALMSEGTAVVISPLIALMKNQVDSLRHYGEDDGVAHFLNSSLTRSGVEKVKHDVICGKTKLLYVAPESLTKESNVAFLKSIDISFFAIDEAHCISEWGHDFRPEYRKIRPLIEQIGKFPLIALTATATLKVQMDIQKNLGIENAKVFKSSFNRTNLFYAVRPKTKDVDIEIIKYLHNHESQSGIIYCLSRKKVEELAEVLRINGISALPYHAGMDPSTRSQNQDAFLQEQVNVIVATIAFGMGIDKPDVRFVIHYDIPKSIEGYYQETGRAGRDGGAGECIAFYNVKDLQKLEKLVQSKNPSEQEISFQLLKETANYAESSVCRRKMLLHYFGEDYDQENCNNCDNCLHPAKKILATENLLTVLEALKDHNNCFKLDTFCNLLAGRSNEELRSQGDSSNSYSGFLKDCSDKYIKALIRQAGMEGYIEKDVENYGRLKISVRGREYLENPKEFYFTEDVDFSEFTAGSEGREVSTSAADTVLFKMLMNLRRSIANKLKLPPYVIFQEQSLEAMATTYPITETELSNIPGVGVGKAKRYGAEFIKLIQAHVEDNDIIRPEDIRVRTIPKDNNLKVGIIQAIDRKIDLYEIAESRNMEFDEFLRVLESIVEAGTRIDLSYFIRDNIDEDQEDDIINYLRMTEEDNLEDAIQELGGDIEEEYIRLVRLMFISEMGN